MIFLTKLSTLLIIFAIVFFHFHLENKGKIISGSQTKCDDVMDMEMDNSPPVEYYVKFDADCYLVTDASSKEHVIQELINDLIVFTSEEKNDIVTLFKNADLENETIIIVKYFDWNANLYFNNDSLFFFTGTYMMVLTNESFQIELLDY